jgi:predicted Rossmann-fold nucleotide-binding protein
VTAEFFTARANAWIDREIRMDDWQQRLFELIRIADGFVACKGGTGTLAEIAVVWEMLNKSVIAGKPFVVLGDFWLPILERVREVELRYASPWGEANGKLAHGAATPMEAAEFLRGALMK